MQQTVNSSFSCKWKRQKMVVMLIKRYEVREAEKWRYAVRKAKIGRCAVRKGGGGCHPHKSSKTSMPLYEVHTFHQYSLRMGNKSSCRWLWIIFHRRAVPSMTLLSIISFSMTYVSYFVVTDLVKDKYGHICKHLKANCFQNWAENPFILYARKVVIRYSLHRLRPFACPSVCSSVSNFVGWPNFPY